MQFGYGGKMVMQIREGLNRRLQKKEDKLTEKESEIFYQKNPVFLAFRPFISSHVQYISFSRFLFILRFHIKRRASQASA
jgi:hypothetical protein